MSLINDALRRASQTAKDRPHQAAAPMGMELAPVASNWRLNVILAVIVLVALMLAGWFFRQWWVVRNNPGPAVAVVKVDPPVMPKVVPPVVPKPVPVAPVAPVPPVQAPVVAAPATPVVAPPVVAPVVVAPPATTPVVVAPPVAANEAPVEWPVDLKLGAIFFSKTHPLVMINGNSYGVGDSIHGVVVKSIEKDKATLEWNGHTKILLMGGQ